jgi:RNA polymerase sigma-70 factor, ECF subfamily
LAHETLLRAWRNRAACRQPADPWPWLAQILHNEALRCLNRSGATSDLALPAEPAIADRYLDDVLDRLSLSAIVSGLPLADRALIRLHYEMDLSVASLARVLDVPETTVKVRLHRARGRLRSNMEQPEALK